MLKEIVKLSHLSPVHGARCRWQQLHSLFQHRPDGIFIWPAGTRMPWCAPHSNLYSHGLVIRVAAKWTRVCGVLYCWIGVVVLHRPSAYQSNSLSKMWSRWAGVDWLSTICAPTSCIPHWYLSGRVHTWQEAHHSCRKSLPAKGSISFASPLPSSLHFWKSWNWMLLVTRAAVRWSR